MSRRDQIIVVAVVAAVALAGFWFVLLSPQLKQSHALATTLASVQTRRDQAVRRATAARAAQVSYTANVAAISRLNLAVPQKDAAVSLLRELDGAAHSTNVDFRTLTVSATTAGPAPTSAPGQSAPAQLPPGYVAGGLGSTPTIQYSLTFAGTYLKLQRFLSVLHRFVALHGSQVAARGRLLDVQGISVHNGNVSMTVVGYIMPAAPTVAVPQATAQTATTPIPAASTAPSAPAATATRVVAATGSNG